MEDHDTISDVFAVADGVVHTTGRNPAPIRTRLQAMQNRNVEGHGLLTSSPIRIGHQTIVMQGPSTAAPPASVPYTPAHAAQVPAAAPLRRCAPTSDSRLIMLRKPNGERARAFRLVGDNLATKRMPRVLAVSSPQPKDGATTCALNLALAIAEHGSKRVLLIDAKFAAPALAGILGVDDAPPPNRPSAYRGWASPFTLSVLTPSLHVATVARRPGGSPSPVDFTTLLRMIDTFLRAGYEQIILDTPVIDGSPETRLYPQLAGGVLLAVRAGATTRRALLRAVEEIGPERALGAVLIDAPRE